VFVRTRGARIRAKPSEDQHHDRTRPGRPRDQGIDRTVLEVARRHLAANGLSGLSITAVAEEAGTTRPAIYRRWATKREIVEAAILSLDDPAAPAPSGQPATDLINDLGQLQQFASTTSATALAGVMLTDGADPHLRALFREHVVMPGRRRIRGYLHAGVEAGQLAPDADIEIAHPLPSGSWLAHALAGAGLPHNWPHRMAALVWRACGGDPLTQPATPGSERVQ
jgi:AcrR family transcriptional regulator